MKNILLILFIVLIRSFVSLGQCSGGTLFATIAAPTNNTTTNVTTCNFSGEYNVITGIVAGNTYNITATQNSNGANRCITVHTGSQNGPVVTNGMGTVTFTAATSGTYYVNINQNCGGCGTAFNCITVDITCTSCPSAGPCASVTNILGCGAGFTTSTTGASSFVSTLCATATPGLESVYSYTATSTGLYSLTVTGVTGGGYAIGYNTSCGAAGWTCIGTALAPGSAGSFSLTAGTTYYFLFDATSTAASSITFQLTCPSGGPTVAGDCGVAANVCSSASFAIDPNGFGAINEICIAGTCAANPAVNVNGINSGCLLSEELNSTWMIVNILTGGSLTFSLGTPNSGTTNCLDWSMWAYSPTTCANIIGGTQAPVRCNYNGSCEEFTGLASALPVGATDIGNWEAPIAVGSLTQYLICLSNYSSAITTVPLSFGGTAVVSCSPLGAEIVELKGTNTYGINKLEWTSTAEYNADKYSLERSLDGSNFSEIAYLDAKGLSLEAISYEFEDIHPTGNEMVYYRVKLMHENGSTTTSNTIAVEHKSLHDLEIVNAFPNPASDELTVITSSKSATSYDICLSDINGRIIWNANQNNKKGVINSTIDVSAFKSGLYFITIVMNGQEIATHKISID